MITQFKDKVIQCPYCGCTLMYVQQMSQVTETITDGKPVRFEEHNPHIALVCKECNAIVRDYDANKILKTGD